MSNQAGNQVAPNSYYIKYIDFDGTELGSITEWFSLEYIKKESDKGYLYLDLPPYYPKDYFKKDAKLEVYKRIGGGAYFLELDTAWYIRLVRYKVDDNGKSSIHILAYDGCDFLDRKIIAYAEGTAYSKKGTNADNMIKAIVRENLGSLCVDPSRDISNYLLIDGDAPTSICPSLSLSFPHQKVLPQLQEICNNSINGGVYLCFDVTRHDKQSAVFRTYTGQRGVNRGMASNNSLEFSLKNGNLSYASLAYDWTEERNVIYAGGKGEGTNRYVAVVMDSVAIAKSPYGRSEDWIDVTQADLPSEVISEANSRLSETKSKVALNAHIQQTIDCIYGLHYGYGDIVTISHAGVKIDVHLDTVHVTLDDSGRDTIDIFGRNLGDSDY